MKKLFIFAGMEVADTIASAPTKISASGENSKPVSPAVVSSVKIIEN